MNTYELSWSDQFCRDDLLTKIDEMALEIDLLKIELKRSKERSQLLERLYRELRKTFNLQEIAI